MVGTSLRAMRSIARSRLWPPYNCRAYVHVLAARRVRALQAGHPRISKRAQGRPEAGRPHGPPATRNAGGSHHRFGRTLRPSLRDGVNAYARALLGDRAFLPPSPGGSSSTRLSASVGAPGPHGFAVRMGRVRLARQCVHRILPPTFVTIAKRPSCGGRTGA